MSRIFVGSAHAVWPESQIFMPNQPLAPILPMQAAIKSGLRCIPNLRTTAGHAINAFPRLSLEPEFALP